MPFSNANRIRNDFDIVLQCRGPVGQ